MSGIGLLVDSGFSVTVKLVGGDDAGGSISDVEVGGDVWGGSISEIAMEDDVSGDSMTEAEVVVGVSEGSAPEADSTAKGTDSATCARPRAQINLSGFIMVVLTESVVSIQQDVQ